MCLLITNIFEAWSQLLQVTSFSDKFDFSQVAIAMLGELS